MLRMVGIWSTRVMWKVSSVALMAEAICAAALVYDTIAGPVRMILACSSLSTRLVRGA